MATYNYNGNMYNSMMNGMYGGNNYQYGYNNGNFSTQTNIVNGVAYQKNVISVGGNCGGDNTCVDGYSLYVPCIKTITKGQNVCFEFFVGDNANQDELDLRDLDDLTLDLSGIFGCSYKSYTYPEDIKSLQYENSKEIYFNDFNEYPNMCKLTLSYFGQKFQLVKPNIEGKYGNFIIGDNVILTADDTDTHIFVGWGKYPDFLEDYDNEDIEDSDEMFDEINDFIISTDKTYSFDITEDTHIFAIYRERKTYKIKISFDNRKSHFILKINDKNYFLSDKVRDVIDILEGYKFVIICEPNKKLHTSGELRGTFGEQYVFESWDDGVLDQAREMIANDDNYFLQDNGNIELFAHCKDYEDKNGLNKINNIDVPLNDFVVENLPKPNNVFDDIIYRRFIPDEMITEFSNNGVSRIFKNDNSEISNINYNGMLHIENESYIKTNLLNIEDGVIISLIVESEVDSKITITLNDEEIIYEIPNGEQINIEQLFRHCNYGSISLFVEGCVNIDNLSISEEVVEDKGKVQLCIPSEDTALMHTGALYASGAINVGGNVFGIDKTLIGNINNLKTINLL